MKTVTLHFVFRGRSKGFIKKGLFGTLLTLKDKVSPSILPPRVFALVPALSFYLPPTVVVLREAQSGAQILLWAN